MREIKKWFFIIRPFTLPASLSPVLVGLYAAARCGRIDIIPAAVTIACAICLQVLSNLINDYCDFRRGSDGADRLGPPRAVSQGVITPQQLIHAIIVTAVLTIFAGAYLIYIGGWPIIAIGVSAMFFAWLYSATSHSLSHLGIADLFSLSYYGFIASLGTAYIQTGTWPAMAFWLGLACGATATGILTTNNIRDVRQDAAAGKRTIIVRLGTGFGKCYYLACLCVAPAVSFLVLGSIASGVLMSILCVMLFALFLKAEGRGYNKILMLTGFYDLAFALLVILLA